MTSGSKELAAGQRVSAVIVNYRTADLTLKCVDSILKFGVAEPRNIIVVDNLSPDDSVARLTSSLPEGVRLIASDRNAGFSAGVNLGAKAAETEILLILNPDTYFIDQSISRALNVFDAQPEVGLVGLDLVYPDGARQYSARQFLSKLDILGRRTPLGRYWPLKGRVARHMMLDAWTQGNPFKADWVMGTGFLIGKALFDKLGGMDEAYFLYMEDVDLCARVWCAGLSVVCVPGAVLIHDHQRSSAAGPFSFAGRMHLKSLQLFSQRFRVPWFVAPGPEGIRKQGF